MAELASARSTYGEQVALDDVDLRILRGARTVITGPNGAGKSTLLEVMAGVRSLDAGRLSVAAARVAFVPQRTAVSDRLPLPVRDVVTLGAWGRAGMWRRLNADDRGRVVDAMARADVAHLARRSFATLSGGQRQRTLLAQGLAGGAELLLLDEPTTALDSASAARIRDILRSEAARGVAVVCATHDDSLLSDGDHVIHLAEGRVVSDTERRHRQARG